MSTKEKLNFRYDLKIREQLQLHEGIETFPYMDSVGKLTVGVGRNLTDRGLSEEEINFLFANDIDLVQHDLDKHLPWWREMNENRQRVLVDMCFNLGITRLLGFVTTLGFMREGKYKEAAAQMLRSKWAKQVKGRALRLSRMMEEG